MLRRNNILITDMSRTHFVRMAEHLFHVVRMRVVTPVSRGGAKWYFYSVLPLVTQKMGPVCRVDHWLSRWIEP